MKSEGCEMAYRTAEFWASRAVFNSTDKLYDIIGELSFDKIRVIENNVISIYCKHNQFYDCLYIKTIHLQLALPIIANISCYHSSSIK